MLKKKNMNPDKESLISVFDIIFKVLDKGDSKEIDNYIDYVMSFLNNRLQMKNEYDKKCISVLSADEIKNIILALVQYKETEKLFSFFKFLWFEMKEKEKKKKLFFEECVSDILQEIDIRNKLILNFLFKDKLFARIAANVKGSNYFNIFSQDTFSSIEFLLERTNLTLMYSNESSYGVDRFIIFEKEFDGECDYLYKAKLSVAVTLRHNALLNFNNFSFESLKNEILHEINVVQNYWNSWWIPRKMKR